MTTPLRPLTTGELLDRTFNLYRNNFALFAGISALAALTLVLAFAALAALGVALPTPGAQSDPRALMGTLAIYFAVLGLFYLIGWSFATGATIYAVSKVHLGKPATIRESYSKVFPRLGRIIGIVLSIIIWMIVVVLIMYLGLFVVGFVGAVLAGAGKGASIAFLVLIFLYVLVGYGFAISVYLRYSLAVQASLLENLKAGQAMKRSSFLTKGSLGRIFLIFLLMGIIGFALNFILQLPTNLLAQSSHLMATIWQLVVTFVAYSVSFPISTIAISLVYYDQRVRKEAFDLQLMMESLDQSGNQTAAAAPIG